MANIFIIEDDEQFGATVVKGLEDAGHTVTWKKDGEEAVTALRAGDPDIMFLDVLLPKRSGFDILKELQRDPSLAHPPIVMLSSSGEPLEIKRAKQLGVKDYLTKGAVTINDLLEKIMMYAPQTEPNPADDGAPSPAPAGGGAAPAPAPAPQAQPEAAPAPAPAPAPEAAPAAETSAPAPAAAAEAQPAESGASTVLVVEDDKFLRDLIVQKLKREQFAVHEAVTGSEALRVAKETMPKIVLLDLILPGLDGFEVLKRLKEDSATAQIPVIILSNLGQREDVERGLRLGAVDFMIKAHFTPGEIVEKIKEIMAKETPS